MHLQAIAEKPADLIAASTRYCLDTEQGVIIVRSQRNQHGDMLGDATLTVCTAISTTMSVSRTSSTRCLSLRYIWLDHRFRSRSGKLQNE